MRWRRESGELEKRVEMEGGKWRGGREESGKVERSGEMEEESGEVEGNGVESWRVESGEMEERKWKNVEEGVKWKGRETGSGRGESKAGMK